MAESCNISPFVGGRLLDVSDKVTGHQLWCQSLATQFFLEFFVCCWLKHRRVGKYCITL